MRGRGALFTPSGAGGAARGPCHRADGPLRAAPARLLSLKPVRNGFEIGDFRHETAVFEACGPLLQRFKRLPGSRVMIELAKRGEPALLVAKDIEAQAIIEGRLEAASSFLAVSSHFRAHLAIPIAISSYLDGYLMLFHAIPCHF